MWPRVQLDISWSDLAAALRHSLWGPPPAAAEEALLDLWGGRDRALACLSVRSGFDLVLQSLALPRGSEVLMSAVNIPNMARIAELHGLVPVPLEIESSTMAPTVDALEQRISPRTRLVVFAHLFGSRIALEPHLETAKRAGLFIVEDCAQAFEGLDFQGHEGADVSLFSFGPIKTATALGGAVATVRRDAILNRMRERQSEYPIQQRGAYAKRIAKYAAIKLVTNRHLYGAVHRGLQWLTSDADRQLSTLARNFGSQDLLTSIRRRPCAALLRLIERRCKHFSRDRLQQRTQRGEFMTWALADVAAIPGRYGERRSHWVLPVVSHDPNQLIRVLNRHGFDATIRHSLADFHAADGANNSVLRDIVFVPVYPELTGSAANNLVRVIIEHEECCAKQTHKTAPANAARQLQHSAT